MYLLYIESSEVLMYLGFGILTLIFWCLLIRWAVRADSIVKNQEATIYFLMKLCEKHGVANEELAELKSHFRIK